MMRRVLEYLSKEFPGLPDFRALEQADAWPSAFKKDQDYLRAAIAGLEKEVERVHETVCTNLQRIHIAMSQLIA